ncbi:hypothetical protein OHT93_26050 [Streptomyces sp. NBC_00191]|uniref:hypothetical protein n=1 Tax=Streptomyces sp. NBC_00191 TaxID=2975674 RepID=UPI0032480EF5
MFEIRIICDPADTDRITTALNGIFATGAVRRLPSRYTDMERLYVTADHRSLPQAQTRPQTWPTPEEAYATAPCITSEIGWTAYHAVGRPTGALLGREFWLRKAAVLDRIALGDAAQDLFSDACEAATDAARHLLDTDQAEGITDPRGYVRQEYAAWHKQEHRAELVAAGRCPNCQWPERDCNCAEHPDA